MKFLSIGLALLASSATQAQSLELSGLKDLFTSRKETLEKVNAGMTKKIVTTSMQGSCGILSTSTQSILKIEGEKVIILSKEKIQPQNTAACRTAGLTTSSDSSILYYEAKPNLKNDLEDLDASASQIKSITQAGEIVTLNLDVPQEAATLKVTIKYDLSKPAFKNMISSQSLSHKTIIEDVADIDLKKVDLTSVAFCDNNDGDASECTEGNYSDILY